MKIRTPHDGVFGGSCAGCGTSETLFVDPRGREPRCAACIDAEDVRRTHDLKCWPPFFQAVVDGTKTFELRKDDRHYRVGDILLLREWEPVGTAIRARGVLDPLSGVYTGRRHAVRVTYRLLPNEMMPGLTAGYTVLAITNVYDRDGDT